MLPHVRANGSFHGDTPHPLEMARIEKRILQRDLAATVGISPQSYSRHISGRILLDDNTVKRLWEAIESWDCTTSRINPPPKDCRRRKRTSQDRDFLYPVPPGVSREPIIGAGNIPSVKAKKPDSLAIWDPREIVARWKGGETKRSLARRFGVSLRTIDQVIGAGEAAS